MEFRFDSVPNDDIVEEIEKKLKNALVEEDITKISRNGKTINIEGEVPTRFVKFLVKKFLGKTAFRKNTRVIVARPGIFEVIYYAEAE